jgi:hypothetical protein
MGFSHLLVSSLNSVKYCALFVGEKGKFRIMCEHPTYPVAICPHSSSPPLHFSLSSIFSRYRTRHRLLSQHLSFLSLSLFPLHCFLHRTKERPAVAKRPFIGPQATNNHSLSHAHNKILIQVVGTIFIDQYRGYYFYVHSVHIDYLMFIIYQLMHN